MIYFPDDFFLEEEKCGYRIPIKLKHIWAEELEMLSEVDRICKKYNIKYFVHYGTLLGAIRHNGFIPWDDDVDLCMMRDDYNRFIEVLPEEKPTWIAYYSQIGKMRSAIHASIMNSDKIRVDEEYLSEHHGCPYIVGFDIFQVDAVPDDLNEYEAIKVIYGMLYQTYMDFDRCVKNRELAYNIKSIENFCGCRIDWTGNVKLQIWNLLVAFSEIYNDSSNKNMQFYPAFVTTWMQGKTWFLTKENFEKAEYVEFENIEVPVPYDYKNILVNLYGEDYMTPLREEGHFIFKKQEEYILKDGYLKNIFPFELESQKFEL